MSCLAFLLAAALSLGLWPEDAGPPQTVVSGVEIYTAEPDDDFWILAVEPLVPPLAAADAASLSHVVSVATRLGADAVLLLAELPISEIPHPEEPFSPTGRYAAAVFLVLDIATEEPAPELRVTARCGPGLTVIESAAHPRTVE